jgi:ABC-type transporter Mla subunit MlaD
MNARALRFRLGLFVLAGLVLLAALITLLGSLPGLWRHCRRYTVTFHSAPGVAPGTPVRRSGIRIGRVERVDLDDVTGRVRVGILVESKYTIHRGDLAALVHGLLGGDTAIDLALRPGAGPAGRASLAEGECLEGVSQADVGAVMSQASGIMAPAQDALKDLDTLLQAVNRIVPALEDSLREFRAVGQSTRDMIPAWRGLAQATRDMIPEWQKVAQVTHEMIPEWRGVAKAARDMVPELQELARETRKAIPTLRDTGAEIQVTAENWGKLGEHLDVLVQTNEQKLAGTLDRLDQVLARVHGFLSDDNQRAVAAVLKNLRAGSDQVESIAKDADGLLRESRHAIQRADDSLGRAGEVLVSVQKAVQPLPERSDRISKNLDESSAKMNKLLDEFRDLLRIVATTDSTLHRFYTDPSLYQHLNDTACMLTRILPRLDWILRDGQVFADKIARHPEVLGFGGVVRPSVGLKESPSAPLYRQHQGP